MITEQTPANKTPPRPMSDAPGGHAASPLPHIKVDKNEVMTALQLFMEPGQITELRAVDATAPGWGKPHTVSGYYSDWAALARDAARINAAGIYFIPNVPNPALLARAANRLNDAPKSTTADGDILRRRWLLIDLDPTRPAGISSNDTEHALALAKGQEIKAALTADGWPEPILADSGNGAHDVYPIDLPAKDGGLCERCLKALAARFNDSAVTVDLTTFNPARIWKLYGTVSRKGDSTPERPHRLAHIIDIPLDLSPVPIEKLEALAALVAPAKVETPAYRGNGTPFDLSQWIQRHNIPAKGPHDWRDESGAAGTKWIFDICPWNPEHTNKSAYMAQRGNGAIVAGCRHNGCASKGWKELRALFEPGYMANNGYTTARPRPAGTMEPEPPTDETPEEMPAPVALEIPNAPAMEPAMFTGWLGDMIQAQAAATETPLELAAMVGLGVLATACQKFYTVNPEPGYFEPLCCWPMVFLDPGNRKTAVVSAMIRPLINDERAAAQDLEPLIKKIQCDNKTIEARLTALRTKAAKVDAGDFERIKVEIEDLEKTIQAEPKPPRWFTEDCTPEHLGTMMAANGECMGIISDESGIFAQVGGRYSNGVANPDLFLKGHAGSAVRVDRGSRPPVILDHPRLTMCLAPQPEALRGLRNRPEYRGLGFLGRPWYCIPPSPLGFRTLDTRPADSATVERYTVGITALLQAAPAIGTDGNPHPHALRFEPAAYTAWKTFARAVEVELRPGERFENCTDWAGKLPGACARLAGLLHCARHAQDGPEHHRISTDTTSRAITLAGILAEHALAAFDCIGADAGTECARRILAWIESGHRATFTARDAWHPLRGTYKHAREIDAGFAVLTDRNFITDMATPEGRSKKSKYFATNPAIVKEWT